MNDMEITCPGCRQELEVPEELFGQVVECPSCKQRIELPEIERPLPSKQTERKKIVIRKQHRRSTKATSGSNAQRPREPSPQGADKKSTQQTSTVFSILIVIGILVFAWFKISSCVDSVFSDTSEPKPRQAQTQTLLPGIRTFLGSHREFCSPTKTQAVSDWAQGTRQRVQVSSGRSLLFYLKGGVVVTVYEDHPTEGRKKIWESHVSE